MKQSIKTLGVLVLCASMMGAAQAAWGAEDTALTIYSSAQPGAIAPELYRPLPGAGVPNGMAVPGYALVRHDRTVAIGAGRSTLRFTDVAGLIDPTTVNFSSLTDPSTRVLEQNFQFDLVSTDKLLLRYIDRPITVERTAGNQSQTLSGTLLSSVGGLVLREQDGSIHTVNSYNGLRFGELPGGLITRPTLEWLVNSNKGGEQRARVAYQTGGVTWWADYNLVWEEGADANSGQLDLSAWVSIINMSGASYQDARLKLIAGDVHRAEQPQMIDRMVRSMAASPKAEMGGFGEKEFFEFHLYTLGRRTTLPDNSTKQIELFDQARKIPARKLLVYYGLPQGLAFGSPYTERDLGTAMNTKVDVYLEFKNEKQFGLGVPLPAGRIRVSKLDRADGSLEFVGEDKINHTPKDEKVRIKLGSAFDVVGERRQVDFAIDARAHWIEEEIEIKLRNHKSLPVEVMVREPLYRWTNWSVLTKTHDYQKEDARTVHFPVRIAKDGETTLRYRVRYTW